MTFTSTWDPATKQITQRSITHTGHDMFCPGMSFDEIGRMVVTGKSCNPRAPHLHACVYMECHAKHRKAGTLRLKQASMHRTVAALSSG